MYVDMLAAETLQTNTILSCALVWYIEGTYSAHRWFRVLPVLSMYMPAVFMSGGVCLH